MHGEAEHVESRLVSAQVGWDANAPRSIFFDDIYYSGDGPAETEHVFLAGNALAERFARAGAFSIGETGFGAGLNFLKTWALWRAAQKPAGARLSYVSLEQFPLRAEDLVRAHRAWPDLGDLSERLRALIPPPVPGFHQINVACDVSLILGYGEAGEILTRAEGVVDAWFFDGFAPRKNPRMWRAAVFEEAARLSHSETTFATFTVAGNVRRTLVRAGFSPEKRAGFGRKKEMLAGRLVEGSRASHRAPWFQTANRKTLAPGARLAIVGGGVAGASLAREARRAGLAATIFDSRGIAAGASGNPAGLIMPRVDLGGGADARFFLQAYLYTIRLLSDLQRETQNSDLPREGGEPLASRPWPPAFAEENGDRDEVESEHSPPRTRLFHPCGVILGAMDDEERERQRKLIAENILPIDWMAPHPDGVLFPQAGVVDPRKFVAMLAGDAPVVKARIVAIESQQSELSLLLDNGSRVPCDGVVLANGFEALSFVEARSLPLSAIAGQVDWFPHAPAPEHAIVFGSYAAPAPDGGVFIGATYEKLAPGARPMPSRAATVENIRALAVFAPNIAAALEAGDAHSRVAVRCHTPDQMPVAGPLPDLGFYSGAYDDLRLGMQRDYPPGEAIPGAWILSGLGARGLVTAPLAAAMIIAEMTNAPSPVGHEIAQALHPARFFIRDLKRARRIRGR